MSNNSTFHEFVASLSETQKQSLFQFVHSELSQGNIKSTRAGNKQEEAYWTGRAESASLIMCYLNPQHYGSATQEFIDDSNQTPEDYTNDVVNISKCERDEYDDLYHEENEYQIATWISDYIEYRVAIKTTNEETEECYVLFLDDENNVDGGQWVDSEDLILTGETIELH